MRIDFCSDYLFQSNQGLFFMNFIIDLLPSKYFDTIFMLMFDKNDTFCPLQEDNY